MIINDLEYRLARALKIPYMNIKVKQPRLRDIDDDNVGLLRYSSYQSLFTLKKEHLNMNEELIEITKNDSFFVTLFIIDDYYKKQGRKDYIPFSDMLIMSLIFFLDIKETDEINKNINEKYISISNEQEQLIFILSNENFEEFSELIRTICCCGMAKLETDEPKFKMKHHSDPNIRKMLEEQVKRYAEEERKKEKENEMTITDVIGIISIGTNYKLNKDMDDLTIWQLNYIYNGMCIKEGNEFTKMQFCSYKFTFENVPNFNWLKDTKIKLPKNNKLIIN